MICTRCQGSGFLNIEHLPDSMSEINDPELILKFITGHPLDCPDMSICDCCGNGEDWYGIPGEHYNSDDPLGPNGPYAYNGGLCECH